MGAFKISAVVLALFAGLSSNASAGTIKTETSSEKFFAAISTFTYENFGYKWTSPIPGGVLNYKTEVLNPAYGEPLYRNVIKRGATYSTTLEPILENGLFFNIDTEGGFSGGFLDSLDPLRKLTVTYDRPVYAFGFHTNAWMPLFTVEINFVSGASWTQDLAISSIDGLSFFGFQSSARDIASVVIGSGGRGSVLGFAFDDHIFTTGNPPVLAVPEPSTYAMLGLGLGLLGVAARRRKSA